MCVCRSDIGLKEKRILKGMGSWTPTACPLLQFHNFKARSKACGSLDPRMKREHYRVFILVFRCPDSVDAS